MSRLPPTLNCPVCTKRTGFRTEPTLGVWDERKNAVLDPEHEGDT